MCMNSKPQSITAALLLASGLILTVCPTVPAADDAVDRWPEEKARAWQQRTGWLVGCNFLPSTAINQLEMFQADTFERGPILLQGDHGPVAYRNLWVKRGH